MPHLSRIVVIASLLLLTSASVQSGACYTYYDYYENYYNDEAQTQAVGLYFCLCGGQTYTQGQLSGNYRQLTWETCNHLYETNVCQHWTGTAWENIPCT